MGLQKFLNLFKPSAIQKMIAAWVECNENEIVVVRHEISFGYIFFKKRELLERAVDMCNKVIVENQKLIAIDATDISLNS